MVASCAVQSVEGQTRESSHPAHFSARLFPTVHWIPRLQFFFFSQTEPHVAQTGLELAIELRTLSWSFCLCLSHGITCIQACSTVSRFCGAGTLHMLGKHSINPATSPVCFHLIEKRSWYPFNHAATNIFFFFLMKKILKTGSLCSPSWSGTGYTEQASQRPACLYLLSACTFIF